MEIQGKIIAVLPKQSGTSKRTGNQWASQDYVIETHEQYPRNVPFGFSVKTRSTSLLLRVVRS
jgi:hypothetical protein